jgi:hypothetical protein
MKSKYCNRLPRPKQMTCEMSNCTMWHCKTCGKFFDSYHQSQVEHICDAPAVSCVEVEKAVKP